jgi:hypothetical protein
MLTSPICACLQGAAPLVSDKSILGTAAGILATEAYHGGAIRALLLAKSDEYVFPYATKVSEGCGWHACLLHAGLEAIIMHASSQAETN